MELINEERTWQDIRGLLGICKEVELRERRYVIFRVHLPAPFKRNFGRSWPQTYGCTGVPDYLIFLRGGGADWSSLEAMVGWLR